MKDKRQIKEYSSSQERETKEELLNLLENSPIPRDQLLSNIALYINSKNLSRILFYDHLYKKIINVPGVIMEFGTRWGQNLSLFSSLRGIYEPFHRHRKIIGFDTFTGFPNISKKDGKSDLMKKGQLDLTKNYENHVRKINAVWPAGPAAVTHQQAGQETHQNYVHEVNSASRAC